MTSGASLGCAPDNSIQIDAIGVSRYHSIIEHRNDLYWLLDLASESPSRVNGSLVSREHQLSDGDLIALGTDALVRVDLSDSGIEDQDQPSSAAESKKERRSLLPVSALVAGLLIVGVVVGGFFAARYLMANPAGTSSAPTGSNSQPGTSASSNALAPVSNSAPGASLEGQTEALPATDEVPQNTVSNLGIGPGYPSLKEFEAWADGLSRQISERGGYTFQPDFAIRIAEASKEFQGPVVSAGQRHSASVQIAFESKGLPPLLGILLAMSQTRFTSSKPDIWNLPVPLLKSYGYLADDAEANALNDSKRSAELAASYLKPLVVQAGGKSNFMYAVALYGEPRSGIADTLGKLERLDPSGVDRRDFWRMFKAGAVTPEQANRVIRFFAAGVVAEHPERFAVSPAASPISQSFK